MDVVSVTKQIDKNNLPKGPKWDSEGGCYIAERVDPKLFGCEWYWSARNEKALAKGYQGQELFDHMPIVLKDKSHDE